LEFTDLVIACRHFCTEASDDKKTNFLRGVFLPISNRIFRGFRFAYLQKINRYFMMENALEETHATYDVHSYGSCHTYTSLDPTYLADNYSISCYNMGQPNEIIPLSYVRMYERFKTDKPKVALVEIWGTNAYNTYIDQNNIFYSSARVNIERHPISLAKLEVIFDYPSLRVLEENFSPAKYKNRLIEGDISMSDVHYSFESLKSTYYSIDPSVYDKMELRIKNNGYLPVDTNPLPNYSKYQPKVENTDQLRVEVDIMKYIDRIIELCQKKEITLIFYRAPYLSKADELRKANYLEAYFAEHQIPYYDLEKEIDFDPMTDFFDYYHLSRTGARKATDFLAERIKEHIL